MAELKESKQKLPVSFLTEFVSRSWNDVGYLKETIAAIGESFSGTKKVEELLQALVDAYLVCIGQLEAHLQAKDYLDTEIGEELEESKSLKEDVDIHIEGNEVTISDNSGEEVGVIPIEPEGEEAPEIPPAEANIEPIEEPTEEEPISDEPFEHPFEFEAPEVEVKKPDSPFADVGDYFVDFDDPQGEPVTEKELYGEGEEPIENEKIDADVEEEE